VLLLLLLFFIGGGGAADKTLEKALAELSGVINKAGDFIQRGRNGGGAGGGKKLLVFVFAFYKTKGRFT